EVLRLGVNVKLFDTGFISSAGMGGGRNGDGRRLLASETLAPPSWRPTIIGDLRRYAPLQQISRTLQVAIGHGVGRAISERQHRGRRIGRTVVCEYRRAHYEKVWSLPVLTERIHHRVLRRSSHDRAALHVCRLVAPRIVVGI